jgi:SRSO17 transposase
VIFWYKWTNDLPSELSELQDIYVPERWGLPRAAVGNLGQRLYQVWERYRPHFQTRTRDTSQLAYVHLRGQLTLDTKRNFAHIEERFQGGDGQALHHFMSNSPWANRAVFAQLQAEVRTTPGVERGSVLILDESADEKAGQHSVGAARQHNGRLGKIGVCQVATCLTYANPTVGLWTMLDGELFLPEAWFGEAYADLRTELGVPAERTFETKLELGLKMIRRVRAAEVPFERVACDELYGRGQAFRAALDADGLRYAAQVPATTQVYLSEPRVGIPRQRKRHGQPPKRLRVLSRQRPREVRALAKSAQTVWQRVRVRATERGWLEAEFAVFQAWTVAPNQAPRAEGLVIRRESDGACQYTLLNDPADTSASTLIEASCQRCWTERAFEDAKTDLGWDEFQAQKYRAWEHHLALTALALWFIAQTKLEWRQTYARDPQLLEQLQVEVLPALSTANVRELLKAVLPLPQFTPDQARQVVATHLVQRPRSTASRLKAHNHRDTG